MTKKIAISKVWGSPLRLTEHSPLRLHETHFYLSKSNIFRVHVGAQKTWDVEYDTPLEIAYHKWLGQNSLPGMGIVITEEQFEELKKIFGE